MSSESWKLEKDLCRCCHSEGSFKNLAEPAQSIGVAEIYADMLNECFDIDMAPVPGLLSAATYTICEICVIRLRDASDFKKQVLSCEERFKDLYSRNGIISAPVSTIDIEVKRELPDSDAEPDDDFKMVLPQDDTDDEKHTETLNIQISEEEEKEEENPVPVEVTKKKKYKTKKTVKCKTSKKTKRKNAKEEPVDDENDSKKKQGRDEALKFRLNEDCKKVGDTYQCARCDKTYDQLRSLHVHVKMKHYRIPRLKCSLCNDRFMNVGPLNVHKLEVHNVDVSVKCSVCNNIFKSKNLLTKHIRNFHMLGEDGKRYKCEFCDYETIKHENMYKHKFKHKTVKDYNCEFCKKSFKRKGTLKLHERIHTGDRRKVCTECGQAFVQKASLNYHMTKYHPEVNF